MINGKKFLIIDDSSMAISIMRSMLISSGISNDNIDSTMDSHKAFRLLVAHSYDIVVCDYNMRHHIDGALIFDEVKHRKIMPSDGVFICVTGDNSQKVVSHFIELEPDDYLIKPFSAEIFYHRIEMALERKSALFPLLLAVDNKEYETAIDLCSRYRGSYPMYSAYIDRINGDCLLRAERHKEARQFYEQACKNYDHIWPQVGVGQALKGLGELKKAEAVFKDILRNTPSSLLPENTWLVVLSRGIVFPQRWSSLICCTGSIRPIRCGSSLLPTCMRSYSSMTRPRLVTSGL